MDFRLFANALNPFSTKMSRAANRGESLPQRDL